MPDIQIDPSECESCGRCVVVCPETVFTQPAPDRPPQVEAPTLCMGCGQCVAVCREDAVSHSAIPREEAAPLEPDRQSSPEALAELMRARRSVRRFKNAPVPGADIEAVVEAARWAPSAHNTQSTAYVVLRDSERIAALAGETARFFGKIHRQLSNPLIRLGYGLTAPNDLAGALPLLEDFARLEREHREGGDPVLFHAPVLLLFHGSPRVSMADANAQLACQNAALMAHARGLGAFYTGYLVACAERSGRLRRMLELPRGRRLYAGLAMGIPGVRYARATTRQPAQVAWR